MEDEFEIIEPDDSKLFCQKRLDNLAKKLDEDIRDSGFKKLMKEMFHEELVNPRQEILSLEEIINRYGDVLTKEELDKLKSIIKPDASKT